MRLTRSIHIALGLLPALLLAQTPPETPVNVPAQPDTEALESPETPETEETLDEVRVQQKREAERVLDAEEERAQAGVTEVISKQELTRLGDTDVAASLRRVTGLSLVGSKFVYVRGLGERFSSVLLNGAQLPSPDPLRRVVPLDLFPNELLDGVSIAKSYQPNLPGEFGGGVVELRSALVSKDSEFRAGGSLGYRDGTTGSSGLRYRGGSRDWLGFDRVRSLPTQSPQGLSAQQNEALSEQVAREGFNVSSKSIQPNVSQTIGYQMRSEVADRPVWLRFGSRYSQSWDSVEELRRAYSTSDAVPLILTRELVRNRTDRAIDLSGLLQAGAEVAEGHRVEFNALALRQTTDQAQVEVGFTDDPEQRSQFTELEWVENRMYANQLSGSHYVPDWLEAQLDWQYTYTDAKRDAPNTRRYRYDRDLTGVFGFSRQTDSNELLTEALDDNSQELRLSASIPWSFGEVWSANFSGGVSLLQRERDSALRRIKFNIFGNIDLSLLNQSLDQILIPENIGQNGFLLTDNTRLLDRYTAEQDLNAAYFSFDFNDYTTWRVAGGIRVEQNDQFVQSLRQDGQTGNLRGEIKETDVLPSISATYTVNYSDQLRLSVARTVSRPDFRELSPSPFNDPSLDTESFGNPDLVQTEISHFDMRYERYLADALTISGGLFYKRLNQPIERVLVPGTGSLLSFINADSADVYGVEIEGYQGLDFYSDALNGFGLSGNVTWSQSSVELGEAATIQTNRNRALQGQSDVLANITISYEPNGKDGLTANLGYNVASARISQVGSAGLPDVEEEPFHDVSATLTYPINNSLRLGARINNLFDQDVEFTQGGAVFRKFSPGPEISFSLQFTL
jgi:outer membrane receptor protein involved in Fe transport